MFQLAVVDIAGSCIWRNAANYFTEHNEWLMFRSFIMALARTETVAAVLVAPTIWIMRRT